MGRNIGLNGNTLPYFLLLAGLMVLLSVLGSCKGRLDGGFAGTYVNSAGSEFSVAQDTLVVEEAERLRYQIHRRTGFRLLDEKTGRPGKLQHEWEEWVADLDEKTGELLEQRHGKRISFGPGRGEMRVGKRVYKRIN